LVQSEAFALSCLIAFLVFLVVVALDLTSFLGYKIGKLNASKLVIGYVITIVGMFVFCSSTGSILAAKHLKDAKPIYLFEIGESGADFFAVESLLSDTTSYMFLFSTKDTHFLIRSTISDEVSLVVRVPIRDDLVMAYVLDEVRDSE
jgi:hypothetical protein